MPLSPQDPIPAPQLLVLAVSKKWGALQLLWGNPFPQGQDPRAFAPPGFIPTPSVCTKQTADSLAPALNFLALCKLSLPQACWAPSPVNRINQA